MNILLERRAEIALRSLQQQDQEKIHKALNFLIISEHRDIINSGRSVKLGLGGQEQLFSLQTNSRLRVIYSFHYNNIIVQDIVDEDKMTRWRGGLA